MVEKKWGASREEVYRFVEKHGGNAEEDGSNANHGDNKFDQIIQNFTYLTWSMETIKQPNKSTFILGETLGQVERVKFHPSINMLLTCHFLIRH